MSSLWARRWDSFKDQPLVTCVEIIFFSFFPWFDGAMAAAGQIWVEGQCDNKDKRMRFPEVPFVIQKKKRDTVQDIIMCSTSKICFVTFFF